MVSAINATGIGNAWGQIKKSLDTVAQAATPPAPTPSPNTPDAPTSPEAPTPPTVVANPAPSEPLTYSAPSSGPRQMTAVADPAPTAGLSDRLSDAGYYASAVADPAATAQTATDSASLTQAQLIAQAAYAIVARAGTDNRMSLIQDG